ncbi:hypothetical protein Sgly_0873 [Syntrophobotulus glycolicus DSM 8271]|uniref:TerB N-terminal domain-containing protein n=1 Tax=Syntrophobotulus glycolicus (strain DSM 8271 / FlGlyR) TaxID=645991 RepID=F0T1V6_SYNGF|nr:TerB N-terminal domain-containing protein [Syntrophobotulus glycolicus]ADY55220.1 hypothetical protein Sgly_0873 [Syntrophobotulus glycolicus DSM 8271]
MANIHALMTLINKIFPNENCTRDNIAVFIRRLALKDVSQNHEHFASVQPPQENQSGKYSPEKITQKPPARGPQSEPYATFKKMRQIGGVREGYLSYYADDAEIFCKQAQLMKDFTDDDDRKIPLDPYCATYLKMDDAQLRTYFTWRTKVRQGVIEDTSLSYAFCYVFELLNDVGVSSPAEAIGKLIALWTAFRRYDEKIDVYLREWIRDYYVVHKPQFAVEFTDLSRGFPVPYHSEDVALLAKAKSCSWDDLRVIEASSSFRITNGQFYKATDQAMIEKCACFVIQELAKLFKSGGVDLRKMFWENRREKIYSLFRGAVHRKTAIQPITVQLDDFETIKLNSRGWYREYLTLTQYRSVIGYILKSIEIKMREHFGYKRSLQMPNISQVENSLINSEPDKFTYFTRPTMDRLKVWKAKAFSVISGTEFEPAIVRAIAEYCKLAHLVSVNGVVKEIKPVEIDLSKLKDIEKEHMETAAKLIVEEQPAPVAEVPPPAAVAPDLEIAGMAGFVDSLPEEGRTLLITLLNGGQVPPNSELLIETINAKALEVIADHMIDDSESVPYVYDDYTEELKSWLGGQ